ncbi:MAG: hypothetical protein RL637_1072 [Pseudomonadota bacterium]|jgi:hypothetical protein
MKLLKAIILGVVVSVSAVGVTSVAHAESDPGRVAYKPAEAIDLVLTKIKAAQEAIAADKSADDIVTAIKAAKDASKEINANDKVDIARIRANVHLSKAIGMAKEKDNKLASEHLKTAEAAFVDLKKLL